MSALRRVALVPVALLAALSAAPAQAKVPPEPLADVLAAAKAICFDHLGDPAAQTAVVTAAPYEAEKVRSADDGTVTWNTDRFSIAILDDPEKKFCMVTAVVDPKTRIGEGIKLARPLLGEPMSADEEFVLWYSKSASGDLTMYGFLLEREGDQMLAAYAAGLN
ncbi:hypothetical protein [Novosphingobium sp.]|uniref:hypothetical protein n=1 Tax=Novosphingobium sp. TaxID=1874826 RepID=UPI00286AB84E|nr:hypothetical protein [Novosphingobium sp.]